MRFSAIVFVLLIFACGQKDTSKQVGVELTTKRDTSLKTTEVVAENKKLSDADSMLNSFFKNLNEVDQFINPKNGAFCIEPGPGATPIIERLFTKEDLFGKTPILFLMRDFNYVRKDVQINPINFDPCKEDLEGFFIFDLKTDQKVLMSSYALLKMQDGKSVNDSVLPLIKALDGNINKRVDVYFQTKYGEFISLKFYFYLKEKKIQLLCLDLRECGV